MLNYLSAVDVEFHDCPGGMGRVAWDHALLMAKEGHRVTLFCSRTQTSQPEVSEYLDGAIHVIRYQPSRVPHWHPLRLDLNIASAARTAKEYLASQSWDILHLHTQSSGAGVLRALSDHHTRRVFTLHSPLLLEQRINWKAQGWVGQMKLLLASKKLTKLEEKLLRQCDAIHTLSQFTKDCVERSYGLGNRTQVIPHWRTPGLQRQVSKEEARRILNWPLDKVILFTVRRHGPRYGLDVAVRAVVGLKQASRSYFVVAGDGPMRPQLMQIAEQAGAADRIVFPGRVSDEDLYLAYQAADVFILPTLELECFGLISVEAMSFGLPVIATDAGAIPEVVRPMLPEFIVPAGDEEALREKIEDFIGGKIKSPPPEILIEDMQRRYGDDVIAPRLVEILTGQNVSNGEASVGIAAATK